MNREGNREIQGMKGGEEGEFLRKEFIEQYVTETKRLAKSLSFLSIVLVNDVLVNELVLCEREVYASLLRFPFDRFPYFLCLKCV